MMVDEALREAGDTVLAEGWRWIDVAPSFAYGHSYGLRRVRGDQDALSEEQQAERDTLQAELDQLEADYAEAEELPDEIDARLGEIETAIAVIDERPMRYDPQEMARAGTFISIDADGSLRIERGYVRPEDEPPVEQYEENANDGIAAYSGEPNMAHTGQTTEEPVEDDGIRPLPDRLVAELTAYRTIALRDALGTEPDIAFLAALHALALRCFYHYALDSCLELDLKSAHFSAQAQGLADSSVARALEDRHEQWQQALPNEPEQLWAELSGWDEARRKSLFAHCVGLSVNAVIEPYSRRPRAIAHADRLAMTVGLDMHGAGWVTTAENYFGRVTKARILQAVREGCGEHQAVLIEHLKKDDMAAQAETLLIETDWLPEPLRTAAAAAHAETPGAGNDMPPAPAGEDDMIADAEGEQDYAVAAE